MAKRKAKNPAAVALGRLGGKAKVSKGLAMLSPEERSAIAKKGAAKRWGKKAGGKGIAAVLLIVALWVFPARAEDFVLKAENVGPLNVHTTLTYDGKGERIVASARNDGSTIPHITLCVTAAAFKGCLFTLWNTSTWGAGEELQWEMTTQKKIPNLAHQVLLQLDAPTVTPKPVAPRENAKPEVVWETGLVLSQDLGSGQAGTYAGPLGAGAIALPIYRRYNRIVVRTDRFDLTWDEVGRKPLVVIVNGEIQFRREGRAFIVMDSDHHEHKFGLVGAVQR